MISFAALAIGKNIFKASGIELDERHSIVIATLWQLRAGETDTVPGEDLLLQLNQTFEALKKDKLTKAELDMILGDLYKLKTLEFNSDGMILLTEKIKII